MHYAGANATSLSDMQRIENTVRREVLAQQMRSLGISAADAERLKRASVDMRAERITAQGRQGSGQISVLIAISVATLTVVRRERNGGTGSVSFRAVIAMAVGPTYGGSPVSISKATQPSE